MGAQLDTGYTSRHATYDLRRLRRRQLIERLPGTRRYQLTARGRSVAVLFTKTYGRVLGPGLVALNLSLPADLAKRSPDQLMAKRRRKTLIVCAACHTAIQDGRPTASLTQ
jgi:hypothetical protein